MNRVPGGGQHLVFDFGHRPPASIPCRSTGSAPPPPKLRTIAGAAPGNDEHPTGWQPIGAALIPAGKGIVRFYEHKTRKKSSTVS